ncbi:MAG: DUF2723 domain-containing protein, partial [Candidatus Hydrogenedentes bacterium]|nr:DUF2723 domain-containing protein [Candidatus Hydrogenedentota bacterium]
MKNAPSTHCEPRHTARLRPVHLDCLAAGCAAAAALVVYAFTLAPSVTGEDSGELVAAAYTLGIPHPTGYPLWCLLAKGFIALLPVHSVAWRAGFMSATFGAVTVFLVALLVARQHRNRVAGLAAGLLLAFSFEFWEQSVIAEVYTLNAFCMAACILLLFAYEESRKSLPLWAFAAIYGLSLGNHSVMYLLGPVFAFFVLWC